MSRTQRPGFVVAVPIGHDADWPGLAVRTVQTHLDALGNPAGPAMREALDRAGSIHFMSMSVIWDGGDDDPVLLLDISGDGKPATVLADLVVNAGHLLLPAFESACGVETLADLLQTLQAHVLSPSPIAFSGLGRTTGLAFQGTPNLSVDRIRKDEQIAGIAQQTIREAPRGAGPTRIMDHVREKVSDLGIDYEAEPSDVWVENAMGIVGKILVVTGYFISSNWKQLLLLLAVILYTSWILFSTLFRNVDGVNRWVAPSVLVWTSLVLAVLGMLALVVLVVGALATALRLLENADRPRDIDPDPLAVRQIMERENRCAQNHLTGVSTVKPGLLRRMVFLVMGLFVVELVVKAKIFKPGFLADVGTIHFAQWVTLPRSRKLLFLSNYDGSWQSYLEDFITEASGGVTGIWSNTADFPQTQWLFLDGAADGDRFKRWARRQQIPTLFWYSAYPDLTVRQIRDNVLIRHGLASDRTPTEAAAWLRYFGSAMSEDVLETHEIQGFALSSYRDHHEGCCVAMAFAPHLSPEDCRAGLASLLGEVTFADTPEGAAATFVAVSAHGVARLGFGDGGMPLASDFPTAFTLGMNSPTRARVLGDVGRNAPSEWDWGGPEKPVDLALLIYAATDDALKDVRDRLIERLGDLGLETVSKLRLQRLPPRGEPIFEPFGFADGISQPSIKGVRSSKTPRPEDLLNAGEFILGYKDGRDEFPSTPQVYARGDLSACLPDMPPEFPGVKDALEPTRDLGRNGSFLVIRQLEQDTEGYEAFLKDAASKLRVPRPDAEAWIGAKMLGRWRNGAPLIAYPDAEPKTYQPNANDEDFLFGRDDPEGLGCPIGAHIRRANPRDAFGVENADQIFLSNRHRLLRRGRAYVSGDPVDTKGPGEGLVFMCVNADLERQFEFVQQTWLSSPAFSGLRGEADAVVAGGRPSGGFTIPLTEGVETVTGLQSFVTVRGGGYFFLPSRRALQYLAQRG
jgi:Dyp-type peroxidase family